jgi:DNA-binding MarR family transcriptional regulator
MGADRDGLTGAGPALFQLVRFWSRRWAGRSLEIGDEHDARVQDVLVLEAIDATSARGAVAVSDVARELGIDQSGASRMVSESISRGYVVKTTSERDARRAALAVTEAGGRLLTDVHAWQDEIFQRITAGWPEAEARQLAGYLRRLAAEQRTDA